VTQTQLCELFNQCEFTLMNTETIRDTSRSSNIPVEYIRAVKS